MFDADAGAAAAATMDATLEALLPDSSKELARAESELATMITEIDKLQELADVWESSQERSLLPCIVDKESDTSQKGVVLENVMYSRGTALVRVEHMEIPPGVYAGKCSRCPKMYVCHQNDHGLTSLLPFIS